MNGSVASDGGVDCDECVAPDGWCRDMPEVSDDSSWQHIGYVGCDPDCVDRTAPEGGDGYPFRTLLSELIFVITDMTYQEKIEALSGTIYDYDDVVDNTPGYFDYNDPRNYEEWCGWDDPGDDDVYYDPYCLDVTDETVASRTWLGVW